MEVLQNDLVKALVRSQHLHKAFLPDRALAKLRQQLLDVDLDPSLRPLVLDEATKVFAILLLADNVLAAKYLIGQANLRDTHLPLLWPGSNVDEPTLIRYVDTEQVLSIKFESHIKRHNFNTHQWAVQAPIFNRQHLNLHTLCPLPFTWFESHAKGGFSEVFRAKIHEDHLVVAPAKNNNLPDFLAVKVIKPSAKMQDNVRREVQALKAFHDLDSHIINHLVTYEHGAEYAIVFPWAPHGNLRHYWETHPPTASTAAWALRQMHNLANALAKMHNFGETTGTGTNENSRHGDLKPENILVFDESGADNAKGEHMLVLTDVGLATFHEQVTKERSESTKHGATMEYIPPNYNLNTRAPTSRNFDQWSIGCIFLEFVIWVVYGWKAIIDFRNSRGISSEGYQFFELDQTVAKANRAVVSKLKEMREDTQVHKNIALTSLLNVIEDKLIQVDQNQRASAEELSEELRAICSRI